MTCNCTLKSKTATPKGEQGIALVPEDHDIRPGLEPRVSPPDTLAICTGFLGIWTSHLRSSASGHSICPHKVPQQLDTLAIRTRSLSNWTLWLSAQDYVVVTPQNRATGHSSYPHKRSQATGHSSYPHKSHQATEHAQPFS